MGREVAMKVLVTGANGFIGGHLCAHLSAHGYEVRKAVRRLSPEPDSFAVGELGEQTDWSAALEGVEVIVHAAARVHVLHEVVDDPVSEFLGVNVKATQHLARSAAKAGVKRLVFISSIGVLGNYSEAPFSESDQPNPSNIYSMSKWEAEQALRRIADEMELDVVIIRPPLVYGPGVKANFLRLMEHVHQRHPMPFRMIHNARDFVSISNLCHFIEQVMEHPQAANQTYLICDGQAVSTPELISRLATLMGTSARLLPVPDSMLHLGAKLLSKERFYHSVCSSLRIDTRKAREELDWKPAESLQQGLEQTVQWFLTEQQNMQRLAA